MRINRILPLILGASLLIGDAAPVMSAPQQKQQSSKQRSKAKSSEKAKANVTSKTAGKTTSGKNTSAKSAKKAGKSKAKRASANSGQKKTTGQGKETSADVKRLQEATQREISETKAQLKVNEADIKKGVNELGRLQGDINEAKEKVKSASAEVGTLTTRIGGLENQVKREEQQLEKLRQEYLKAIKKIRGAGKSNSTLAFIFSSGSFNQALRRMRYLKEFSAWKERQSAEIGKKVDHLKAQREQLARTRTEKDAALRKEQQAHKELQGQYAKQDAIVVELRANGEALNAHLAKKQAEANTLRNRISALIAAEETARRQREEAAARERKEREEREAKERAERERAEKERADRERAEKAEKEREASESKAAAESTATGKREVSKDSKGTKTGAEKAAGKKPTNASRANKAESTPKNKKQEKEKEKETKTQQNNSGTSPKEKKGDYANARKRKPRSENTAKPAPSKQADTGNAGTPSAAKADNGGSFEKMRGSLPRPVSGSFRITSPFGRHSLPELPDVVYDNPGIDAQVAAGATATAVYGGKVSGVYMIPGFSTVVIVSHGNYYTVYGNIASPSVKVGDSVKQGQALGKLAVDEEDKSHSSIHFEVWKNRDKLNPAEWIR